MFCANCGAQLPEGAKFCGKCGTPQGGVQPAQPAVKRLYFDAKGLTLFNYKFDIRDEAGNVCYQAATVTESMIRHNARVYDLNGNTLIHVSQQKKLTMVAVNFDIMDGADNLITEAIQKVNLVNYIYELKQLGISLSGNFLKLEFDFVKNGAPIAKVRKKFLSWGDSYELEFSDPSLELVLLACIMMIQIVCAIQRNRRRR
ncbi:MAG: zinc-ribbon domain-containing protein [Clostridia bacterium]|nr:zinc-ribbon domain-containing protein [Clostridia bacterium]